MFSIKKTNNVKKSNFILSYMLNFYYYYYKYILSNKNSLKSKIFIYSFHYFLYSLHNLPIHLSYLLKTHPYS